MNRSTRSTVRDRAYFPRTPFYQRCGDCGPVPLAGYLYGRIGALFLYPYRAREQSPTHTTPHTRITPPKRALNGPGAHGRINTHIRPCSVLLTMI